MKKNIVNWQSLSAIIAMAVFVVFSIFFLAKTDVKIDSASFESLARTSLVPLGSILLALIAAAGAKYLLSGEADAASRAKDGGNMWRDLLAERVVTFGVVALAALGIAVIAKGENALSIFNSVLPVISTWIGTVLAFYFSKESFRQAAESTQGLLAGSTGEPITRPGTMVGFDKIVKHELSTDEIKAANNNTTEAAEKTKLKSLRDLFQPPGIMRVVVFDDKKIPIYVIRHADLPPEQQDQTVLDYLKLNGNKPRALNFSYTSRRATIRDGQRLIQIRNVTDLFITENGRADEPVLGWVPAENL